LWEEFNNVMIVNDPFLQTTDCYYDYTWTLNSSGVVQYPSYRAHPAGYVDNALTTVIANSSGSCGGDGTGTLYAVQVAVKDGVTYALGGDSTQSYSGGPGTVYVYDQNGTTCWAPVGSGDGTPQGNVISIVTDNSGNAASYGYVETSVVSPYLVWAVDNSSNIWAVCSGSSCAALGGDGAGPYGLGYTY
jgi:hypothetical protein